MKTLKEFKTKKEINILFSDIDDTLTSHGELAAATYQALWKLHDKGIHVVPVTGRPAGWCDMIARFWPVAGVIGENGAFYFRYQRDQKKMKRFYAIDESLRKKNNEKLEQIKNQILQEIPEAAVSPDQFCRLFDLAIDLCEDIPALSRSAVDRIVSIFKERGANVKISSIHINGWFGDYDKLTMCRRFCELEFHFDLDAHLDHLAFIGDSPNDEPMFAHFKNSFAVANIQNFIHDLQFLPAFVTSSSGGEGFVEFSNILLSQ